MGILVVLSGDFWEFGVQKFEKCHSETSGRQRKAREWRAFLAPENNILQISEWLAGMTGFEPAYSRYNRARKRAKRLTFRKSV